MAVRTANVNVRVDPEIRKKASDILEKLGMTESGAINMFYNQIVLNNGLPFEVKIPSPVPDINILRLDDLDREIAEGYRAYLSGQGRKASEVFDDLKNELK